MKASNNGAPILLSPVDPPHHDESGKSPMEKIRTSGLRLVRVMFLHQPASFDKQSILADLVIEGHTFLFSSWQDL